ncbi:MAG: phosphatidylserine/phosphatidylglycerophosphate/cardiolipin synthase family protein [Cyanobacteria bacterium NC_groundwater_1444_Ag_S-0.65um_54_12]|nr:phosphatidylserine/phosphatidylglycerophosphate/cardiolipin synthase family protein [Cyanobacteria bacterium NC_groundwater_1444_Ag_S-0.65um_54_12]
MSSIQLFTDLRDKRPKLGAASQQPSLKAELALIAEQRKQTLDRILLNNPTTANTVTYHVGAEESFQAMLATLQRAKKSFYIETYIWRNDHTGRQMAEALVAKVRAAKASGSLFDAKVLIDETGLRYGEGNGTADHQLMDYMRKNGVAVQVFNPKLFVPSYIDLSAKRFMPVTHRKVYIADGERYLIGGRNVGDEYFRSTYQLKWGDPSTTVPSYHDILMTVEGAETARILKEFFKNWKNAGGTVPAKLPPLPLSKTGTTRVQTFVTDPVHKGTDIKRIHLKAIANARREIFLITPYLSDDDLIKALGDAKRRNAELRRSLFSRAKTASERQNIEKLVPQLKVKVLIPLKGEADGGWDYQITMESARQLLKLGIEVRASTGGTLGGSYSKRFSHFKCFLFDGEVLSIGSANGDTRTYHNNHEIVNLIADSPQAKKIEEFQKKVARPDWESATPIDLDWIKRNSTLKERVLRRIYEWTDLFH